MVTPMTPARRITRVVNANYGICYAIYFDRDGYEVGRSIGPGDPPPRGELYRYTIRPTRLGPQPQQWTREEVQDELLEQDREHAAGLIEYD